MLRVLISLVSFFTDAMIGDVNLYLNDQDDPRKAEIEIMIAGNYNTISYILELLSEMSVAKV